MRGWEERKRRDEREEENSNRHTGKKKRRKNTPIDSIQSRHLHVNLNRYKHDTHVCACRFQGETVFQNPSIRMAPQVDRQSSQSL